MQLFSVIDRQMLGRLYANNLKGVLYEVNEKFVNETHSQVPVCGESDLLVIGGGIAGVAAALAASRNNKKVTLIEKSIILGGLATLGHVCIYLPLCDGLGHKIYGGIAEELLYTTIKYGYSNVPDGWEYGVKTVEKPAGRYQTHFNIPACVMAFDELMAENNVEVIFDTVFCAPIMDGNVCKGVIVENKSGRSAYIAKMVIDASGDADVMFRAGAPCIEQKSIVSHWAYELDFETMKKGIESGDIINTIGLRWIGLRPDADNSQSEIPRFYGTTSDGVNAYIRFSRTLALDFLKKNRRSDYTMLSLPTMPQFRTTRRIKGQKELSLVPGLHLDDSVGCVINCLDSPAAVYEFPYGALIDGNITNIITAGRIVAADGAGWEIMRYIPGCAFTGQVAGTAAAMSIDAGCTLQNVDVAELQEKLTDSGVLIHMGEDLRDNEGKAAYAEPTKQFDPLIKLDSLCYPTSH